MKKALANIIEKVIVERRLNDDVTPFECNSSWVKMLYKIVGNEN